MKLLAALIFIAVVESSRLPLMENEEMNKRTESLPDSEVEIPTSEFQLSPESDDCVIGGVSVAEKTSEGIVTGSGIEQRRRRPHFHPQSSSVWSRPNSFGRPASPFGASYFMRPPLNNQFIQPSYPLYYQQHPLPVFHSLYSVIHPSPPVVWPGHPFIWPALPEIPTHPGFTTSTENPQQSDPTTSAQTNELTSEQPDELTSAQPDELISEQPDESTSAQPDELTSAQPDELTSAQPDELISEQSVTSEEPTELISEQLVTSEEPNELTSEQAVSETNQQPEDPLSEQPALEPSEDPASELSEDAPETGQTESEQTSEQPSSEVQPYLTDFIGNIFQLPLFGNLIQLADNFVQKPLSANFALNVGRQ